MRTQTSTEHNCLKNSEREFLKHTFFKIGDKHPSVEIHTGYSSLIDDQEFVLAFETDESADFSELVTELRGSEASLYAELETPLFTCVAMDKSLDQLG
jgi:chlorite dismutase